MNPTLGEIQLYSFSFDVEQWSKCAGQIIEISQNQALYSLLETKYGGDGRITFALPDLRGAEPIPGMCYYIAMDGVYPQRA